MVNYKARWAKSDIYLARKQKYLLPRDRIESNDAWNLTRGAIGALLYEFKVTFLPLPA